MKKVTPNVKLVADLLKKDNRATDILLKKFHQADAKNKQMMTLKSAAWTYCDSIYLRNYRHMLFVPKIFNDTILIMEDLGEAAFQIFSLICQGPFVW